MCSENKSFLKEISIPLIVALVCGIASIGLQIARPIVRNRLYRELIYWQPDISNAIIGDHALSSFVVVNESGLESEENIEFSFQLYKEKDVEIVLHKKQNSTTQHINNTGLQSQIPTKARKVYLCSPDEKTIFTLQPELKFHEEGWQDVSAKRSLRLENNELTCIAIVLWDFPCQQKTSEHKLYVNNRRCKSYLEYVTYKNYLKWLKEIFYAIFWIFLLGTCFALGVDITRWRERRKSRERRVKEDSIEDTIEKLDS